MAKPEIRLKGFEGEWKEMHFSESYKYASEGGTPSTSIKDYYYDGQIPFVKVEDTEKKYIYDTKSHITEKGMDNSSAWLVPSNSIIFTNGATIGNVAINKVPVATKQGILGVIPNTQIFDLDFLYYALLTEKFQKEVERRQSKGTFATIILKNLNQICVPYTTFIEQQEIAGFFGYLDTLILLLKKKITSLKQMKSASLISMFPQVGETTPHVRFKGFGGEWKKVIMNEVFIERHEISTITNELPQLSFTIEEGVILPENRKTNKRDFLIKDKSNKKYLVTYLDDIIYNPANVVYGAIHKNSLRNGCVSPIYKIFYTDQNALFMECVVRRKEFINEMTIYMEGTVQKLRTLKPESFLKMSAYIAPTIDEQKKIGSYFNSLDKQISLQEQRLEKLKQIKAACLDKMFV